MNERTSHRVSSIAAHVVFVAAVVGAIYSFKNYYVGTQIVVPSVKALAPTDAEVTMRVVSPHVASTVEGEAVKRIVRSQLESAAVIHNEWLIHSELRQELLRNELVLWVVVALASFVVVVVQHKATHAR